MMKKKLKVILSIILVSAMCIGAVPGLAFAEENADQSTLQFIDQKSVDDALRLIEKYQKEKTKEAYDEALNVLKGLNANELIKVFFTLNRDYYFQNYKDGQFKFFDARVYRLKHPEIQEKNISSIDPEEFALNYYLERGIFEGHLSETDFDPVIAILLSPEAVMDAILSDQPLKLLQEEFYSQTGISSTKDYVIVWGPLVFRDGKWIRELEAVKEGEYDEFIPDPADREAVYKNSRAAALSENYRYYELFKDMYSLTTQSITLDTPNGTVNGSFYGEMYGLVRPEEDKDYTFMIYMCGSDQEMKQGYVRVTAQLLSMAKACADGELDNINVILCIGGSPDYKNTYMSDALNNIGAGIYYLNSEGLTKEAKDYLNGISSDNLLNSTPKLAATDDGKKIIDSIITGDVFVPLANLGSVDMGDGQLLTGFIDFATQLFPAEDYGLSLSNHGGGLLGGVCISESAAGKFKGTAIETYELEAALSNTYLYRDLEKTEDGKLGLLFFDACLMGSYEEAYSLSDYYRYMVASQQMTISYTDYYKILKLMNSSAEGELDDAELALKLAKDYQSTPWHKGMGNVEATMSVYASKELEAFSNNLKDAFAAVIDLARNLDPNGAQAYYLMNSVRRAGIASADYYSDALLSSTANLDDKTYVDIGEFLYSLRDNLNGIEFTDIAAKTRAIEALDKALNSGFSLYNSCYIDNGINLIEADKGGSVISVNEMNALNSEIRQALKGNKSTYYGASILFPLNDYSKGASILTRLKYNSDYASSDLDSYINFLQTYYDYYRTYFIPFRNGLRTQMKNLTREGSSISLYSNPHLAIKPAKVTTYNYDGGTFVAVTFNVESSYAAMNIENAPANTTGSVLQDIIETSPGLMFGTFEQNGDKLQLVNRNNITMDYIAVDTNQISIDLTKQHSPYNQYKLSDTSSSVWAVASDAEFDSSVAYGLKEALGIQGKQIVTTYGKCEDTQYIYNGTYLVYLLKSGSDYEYAFCGAVSYDSANSKYSKIDGVQTVGAYSYYYDSSNNRVTEDRDNVKSIGADSSISLCYVTPEGHSFGLTLDGINYTGLISVPASQSAGAQTQNNGDNSINDAEEIKSNEEPVEEELETAAEESSEEITELNESDEESIEAIEDAQSGSEDNIIKMPDANAASTETEETQAA